MTFAVMRPVAYSKSTCGNALRLKPLTFVLAESGALMAAESG